MAELVGVVVILGLAALIFGEPVITLVSIIFVAAFWLLGAAIAGTLFAIVAVIAGIGFLIEAVQRRANRRKSVLEQSERAADFRP